jgi:capsular polysaccharide biosynthesis protein
MSNDYDLVDFLRAIRRYWWIALLTPAIVFGILSVRNVKADYQTSFRASVLLPGDTEIPGSSERPELMILDDIGPVVSSQAFAQMVADAVSMPVADVKGHLEASRYSRIVTVTARDSDKATSRRIADGAAQALPGAVNTLMVAQGGQDATVNILDPPGETTRGDADKWRVTALATVVALAVGCFLAIVADASLRLRGSAASPTP